MTNKIYDFDLIFQLKARQKGLVFSIFLLFLAFLGLMAIFCAVIESNILLTVIFALLLLSFLLSSVLIYKIKYHRIGELITFLDNLETGSRDELFGRFKEKTPAECDESPYDKYVFIASGKEIELMIHSSHSAPFEKNEKYRLECVGGYIYGWAAVR